MAASVGVTCEPFISTFEISSSVQFLLLGSDGIWDGVSVQEVGELLAPLSGKKIQALSNRITNASLRGLGTKNLMDNTTNIIVKFSDF